LPKYLGQSRKSIHEQSRHCNQGGDRQEAGRNRGAEEGARGAWRFRRFAGPGQPQAALGAQKKKISAALKKAWADRKKAEKKAAAG